MLNSSEKAKRPEPKGKWSSTGVLTSPVADVVPPAERRDASPSSAQALTQAGMQTKRDKPEALPMGKRAVRQADRAAGKG